RAPVLRKLRHGGLDLCIQCLELLAIGLCVGPVGFAAGCIGSAEGLRDVRHIDLGIGHRLPGMGIELAVVMMAVGVLMPVLMTIGGVVMIVLMVFLGVAEQFDAL